MFLLCITNTGINAYVITTNVNTYNQKCDNNGKYPVREISHEIVDNNVIRKIRISITELLTKSVTTKLNLTEIILVESDENFVGMFCAPSTIVLVLKNNDFEITTLFHEIMHMIDHDDGNFLKDEWISLNKFNYTNNSTSSGKLISGFVSEYAASNYLEDVACTFEELMMGTYSSQSDLDLNEIILEKIKLLYLKLVIFHSDFKKIIKERLEFRMLQLLNKI